MRKFNFILFAAVIFIIAFNWIGWPYQIRFNYPPLNGFIFALLCILFPLSMFLAAISVRNKSIKIAGAVLSIFLSLPLGFLALFACFDAKLIMEEGSDNSMQLLDQASIPSGTFRLYRTDCGATCSFGLLLRKEIDTPIGIKLVRTEWSIYKQSEAGLEVVENSLRIVNGGETYYELQK
ncbi:MAG: hypothetical protein H7A09_09105 [Oceanospirillaceae bacterium]|nr:hypothetical protein [Oceanospirillaceae bacterium]MCP5349617.1 hypothetical protein [Oceanospirillaceae bacterium]